MVSITLQLDIQDTEQDFYNQIVADNEGLAIQELSGGKLLDFLDVTPQQKKDFALKLLSNDFAQRYNNAQVEKLVHQFRNAEVAKRNRK